eukprot:TRINITY_DN11673_c0_g1_i2.p1 TRINITY_DN11673_c0_g1~~TRINITY_DN11673_c0_g1_i2.p1  ORF type:complete len:230 (-),score=42.91 TRINITY_DN11673_c0_g1_i2:151-840(-)
MIHGFGEPTSIERLKEDLTVLGSPRVSHHPANLTDPNQAREMVEYTLSEMGSIDILCNNAGVQHTCPIETFPTEKWDMLISLLLSSPFHTTQTALPSMKKNGWGRIINIASVHGLVASVNKCAYVSAKHGLIGLTKVTALEYAQHGITANAICPGFVSTDLIKKQIHEKAEKMGTSYEQAVVSLLREKQPSENFVQAVDIAQLVLFLCSDAASQITGTSIPVDGGWTAQ